MLPTHPRRVITWPDEAGDFLRRIEGRECVGLFAQEFWHHGVPSDLANILFIGTDGGAWTSCFADGGAFRWADAAPRAVTGGEPAFEYRLADVGTRFGLVGQRMHRARFAQPDPGCARLTIQLDSGLLVLDHSAGHTRLAFAMAP